MTADEARRRMAEANQRDYERLVAEIPHTIANLEETIRSVIIEGKRKVSNFAPRFDILLGVDGANFTEDSLPPCMKQLIQHFRSLGYNVIPIPDQESQRLTISVEW